MVFLVFVSAERKNKIYKLYMYSDTLFEYMNSQPQALQSVTV